jgi:hypothetical protein
VYTGDADEEGYAGARKLTWYIESNRVPPQFRMPPGYPPATAAMRAGSKASIFTVFKNPAPPPEYFERGLVFAGNPDTVYQGIMKMYDHLAASATCLSWARPASSTTTRPSRA